MDSLNENIVFITAFIIFSVPASIIDIKQKRIPDWIVFPGVIVLLGLRTVMFRDPLINILLEMISGFLILFGIRLFTKGKLGMGDVKFAAQMGVFLGFPVWFAAAGLASVFGLMFALTGLVSGKLDTSTKIPFAPFLTLGSITAYILKFIYL